MSRVQLDKDLQDEASGRETTGRTARGVRLLRLSAGKWYLLRELPGEKSGLDASSATRIRLEDLPEFEGMTEEEMRLAFGAGPKSVRLGVENLESRELMAANLGASLVGNTLRIEGTDKADSINVRLVNNQLSIDNVGIQVGGQIQSSVDISKLDLNGIQIFALAGDDIITLDRGLDHIGKIDGGAGIDSVRFLDKVFADFSTGKYTGIANDGMTGIEEIQAQGGISSTGHTDFVKEIRIADGSMLALTQGGEIFRTAAGTETKILDNAQGLFEGTDNSGTVVAFAIRKVNVEKQTEIRLEEFTGGRFVDIGAADASQTSIDQLSKRYVNYDALSYDAKAAFDLTHKFTDSWGFAIDRDMATGNADGVGDATWRTGLAITATAQLGDNAATAGYLRALLNNGWDSKGNPIRHPADQRSLSQDGFTTVLSGLWEAYSNPRSSAEVKNLAKDLTGKYIVYLTGHDWRLAPNTATQADYFLPNPISLYALQDMGAKMGFVTSQWNISETVMSQLLNTISDMAAAFVDEKVVAPIEASLGKIDVGVDYDAPKELNWMSFHFHIKLPQQFRHDFAVGVGAVVRETLLALVSTGLTGQPLGVRGAQAILKVEDLVNNVLQKLQMNLPSEITRSEWTSMFTGALQEVMPWMNGSLTGRAVLPMIFLSYMTNHWGRDKNLPTFNSDGSVKRDDKGAPAIDKKNDVGNFYNTNLAFWQISLITKLRPEIYDVVKPFADQFTSSISKHNPGLWAWYTQDTQGTNGLLEKFRNHQFDNTAFVWEKPLISQVGDREDMKFGKMSKEYDRLDYLLLKNMGASPTTIGSQISTWSKDLGDKLRQLGKDVVSRILADIKNAGKWVRQSLDALGNTIRETWDKAGNYVKETWDKAGGTLKQTWNQAGDYIEDKWDTAGNEVRTTWKKSGEILKQTWSKAGGYLEESWDKAGKYVSNAWDKAGNWISKNMNTKNTPFDVNTWHF